jgi:hypothetical protein
MSYKYSSCTSTEWATIYADRYNAANCRSSLTERSRQGRGISVLDGIRSFADNPGKRKLNLEMIPGLSGTCHPLRGE